MTRALTIGDLYKARLIREEHVQAAVDAFIGNPSTTAFGMVDGHSIDLQAAVAASSFAVSLLAGQEAKLVYKRAAVRTAILLARSVKG